MILELILLVFGGLILGVHGILSKELNILARICLFTIGFAAISLVFSWDFLLQLRGGSSSHIDLLPKIPEGADQDVYVSVPPLSCVVYWAAGSADVIKNNPIMAYNKTGNTGVAMADDAGRGILKIRNPINYKEPNIDPHVYYRVCKPFGMFSRVKVTAF